MSEQQMKIPEQDGQEDNAWKVTRRHFLKVVGVTAGLTVTGAGCRPAQQTPRRVRDLIPARVPVSAQYPEVPYPPRAIPEPGPLRFFTPHEAQTVETFSARLLPGTPDDPGAREAGVVYYMDNLLAELEGFAEPVYREPPFAETYEGDAPPADGEGAFNVIWVPEDEIERYGYQSVLTPREVFRLGVAGLDRYANEQFDEDFVDLSEEQQDEIIQAMVDGEATGFDPLSAEAVFHTFRRYTNEGMFSDPVYGGNRDMVGWKLIGYPGAQRAYTVEEIQTEGEAAERPVWSLVDLPHMHPGEPVGENTILPVSGSEERKGE
ncbi:MAG TPA: gluconate 2-dehydrogenase subunit 3 family protein [Candidatus Sulfomarinibacteraceae bacterium]|nr:gluconate 2-dehydrogenase subunit 3 family protein [Candidatus Sulfomarinibacteraceae bacterium]